MKKKLCFFPLLWLLVSCVTTPGSQESKIEKILSQYEQADCLSLQGDVFFNYLPIMHRNASLTQIDNLKGYTTYEINSGASTYKIQEGLIEEFLLDSAMCYQSSKKQVSKQFATESMMDFLGYTKIFEDAKKQELKNNIVEGSVSASDCPGIVHSFIYGLGNFDDHYENYDFNSNIRYRMTLNLDTKSIDYLELDLLDIAKLKGYSVTQASEEVTFQVNPDVTTVLDEHPFPSNGGGSDNGNASTIKNKGIQFIEDCYGDMKYISDSLTLYTNTILSTKLSFSYTSSRPDVLENNGTFHPVSEDTSITLTVDLKYASTSYAQKEFTFLAVPKKVGTGELGSLSNPLYQGRKPIEDVKINFIEMHEQYGDAIYIQAGDFDMLIDAGNVSDGGYVNDFIRRNLSDGRLECVVATHAHGDHIGGMMTALSTVKSITYAVDYGYQRSNYGMVNNVRNRFKTADFYAPITDCINETNGARKKLYITSDFYITFLDTGHYRMPSEDVLDEDAYNSTSVTLMMTYQSQNFYFAGDLESDGESTLLRNESLPRMTVAKASHHGSSTSNTTNLLSKIRPMVSVISTALVDRGSASHNSTSQIHPNGNTLEHLISYSNKVYCNFTAGTVQVTCDGSSTPKVHGLGLSSPYYLDGRAITGEEDYEFSQTAWARRYRSRYI